MKLHQKQNEYSKEAENNASLFKRFYQYQKERFPLLGHGLLVASFSFSAISYSRICRGAEGFVAWPVYFVGIVITISLFLLVRIFDEFKDADDDSKYRKKLAVPRGLVSLKELLVLGILIVLLQIAVNLFWFPQMLVFYGVVIFYLLLMGKEFFIADWLKKNQFFYITSHMFIIPLIDIYASGLDWYLEGVPAPTGLLFFFAVSYMNGIVLEIGRKIRIPEKEEKGVITYSFLLGYQRAIWLWMAVLMITFCLGLAACYHAGFGLSASYILSSFLLLALLPAILALRKKTESRAKMMELVSALWTIAMYLSLGGIPMLMQLF
jgi:4-hydroxybenzoate polyprenyltransferase